MPRPDPAHRPFVGRLDEQAALASHIAAARDGHGRVVLVTGEPGIGKTRLVEEATAAVPGGHVHWGRCHETEGAPAFWPWTQALRSYVRGVPADRLRRELALGGAEVARVVPAVRAHCPELGGLDAGD